MMVADVTETRNVIPSLEFKTCMTIKSLVFTVLSRFEFLVQVLKLISKIITRFRQPVNFE